MLLIRSSNRPGGVDGDSKPGSPLKLPRLLVILENHQAAPPNVLEAEVPRDDHGRVVVEKQRLARGVVWSGM